MLKANCETRCIALLLSILYFDEVLGIEFVEITIETIIIKIFILGAKKVIF
jgi:hypothetical protein